MGNRRMGLGRLEALLEAVDRDLNLINTTLTDCTITTSAACTFSGAIVGGAHTAAVAAVVHQNTVTAASIGTAAIAANTLRAGNAIHVFSSGIATATNSTDTLTLTLKVGSTAVLTTAALDVANDDIYVIDAWIQIRTIGGSGTAVAAGHSFMDAAGGTRLTERTAQFAVATNAQLDIKLEADWSVANAGNVMNSDTFIVTIH